MNPIKTAQQLLTELEQQRKEQQDKQKLREHYNLQALTKLKMIVDECQNSILLNQPVNAEKVLDLALAARNDIQD
jgi:hypothetical protein